MEHCKGTRKEGSFAAMVERRSTRFRPRERASTVKSSLAALALCVGSQFATETQGEEAFHWATTTQEALDD